MEKITFVPEGGEAVAFYVLEQTSIGGVNYILVTDAAEEEDGEAYILKVKEDLPAVRLIHPGKGIHQGRLACP